MKLWVSFAKEPYKRDDILQLSHMCATGIYIRGSIHVHGAVYTAEYRLFYGALLQKRPIIETLDGGLRLMLHAYTYEVALVSSINEIMGLFCKRAL